MQEKLSSLVDAEVTERERDSLLSAMDQDRELRKTWERFHLIRAAMRHELSVTVSPNLADRVAARIQDTPATVVSFPRRFLTARRFAKGAAGLAVAASVAALSITGLRLAWPTHPGAQSAPVAKAPTVPAPTVVAANPRRGIHWDTPQPELENSLNAFLVQHSEFTPTSGMGVMSYVRIAGYDSKRE